MVAKLVIFNGINEQWLNIFVFFCIIFCVPLQQHFLYNYTIVYYDTLTNHRGVGRRHGFGPALPGFQIHSGQHVRGFPLPYYGSQHHGLSAYRSVLRIVVARLAGRRFSQASAHYRTLRRLHYILYFLQREPIAYAWRTRSSYIIIYQRQRRTWIHCRGCRVLDC